MRINKYLSSIGVASRRAVDKLISENRVRINKNYARLGDQVDPQKDGIEVDNKPVSKTNPFFEYIILNKPEGVISSTVDTHDRQTVLDLVPNKSRLYPVGRLDYDSSGLILLTNDGDLALKLTHPRFHLPKTYHVTVTGLVDDRKINKLKKGVDLEDGKTLPCDISIITRHPGNTVLEIILYQGKKRQIRRMCESVSLKVWKLHRVAIGPITIGELKSGKYRHLKKDEISRLKQISI
ncbi:MAG: pseudouridine synthase [Candidatus Shapirobacteria bacterium]|jgi:pseudouridine synthase